MKLSNARVLIASSLVVAAFALWLFFEHVISADAAESPSAVISITPLVPSELNPQGGGAPEATFEQAAQFA